MAMLPCWKKKEDDQEMKEENERQIIKMKSIAVRIVTSFFK